MHQNRSSEPPRAVQPANVPAGTFRDESFRRFLPIPDEIFHSGIYVVGAGHRIAHSDEDFSTYGAGQPPFYQFNWEEGRIMPDFAFDLIEEGAGIFESRLTGQVEVGPGMGFMVFPGIWHRFRPTSDSGWTVSWMSFNGEFAHQLLNQRFISPERAIIRPNQLQATRIAMDQLLDRVHADPASNSLLLSLQVIGVLATLGETPADFPKQRTPAAEKQADPVVSAALAFIWTSSHYLVGVKDVVGAVGVSRRTLDRRMAEVRGRSVLEEIIECRYNRATRLLRETQLPLKTIATLAGFSSVQHLRRAFASRTGLLPKEHRRQRGLHSN